jgi:hypothetical protein
MAFPLPRYKNGFRPIRSSPVDRDIVRESDRAREWPTPIPTGKNTRAPSVEFAALNKPKIAGWDNGAIGQRLGQLGVVARAAIREICAKRNMCKASYLLISPECQQLARMQTRKALFRR